MPTTETVKKQQEGLYISRVQSLYPTFPAGDLSPIESPDFLIGSDRGKLGVEMTLFIKGQDESLNRRQRVDVRPVEMTLFIKGQGQSGSPLRQCEAIQKRIVDAAKVEFENAFNDRLSVHLHWSRTIPPQGQQAVLATELARVISQKMPAEIGSTTTLDIRYDAPHALGTYVLRVSIRRREPGSKNFWSNVEAGFIEVDASAIHKIIACKNAKVPAYLKNCDRVWLVIVADAEHISSSVEISQLVAASGFSSDFEKVLFYDAFVDKVYELPAESSMRPN